MKRMLFVVALLSILGHGYGQFKISGDVVYMNPTMNYLDSVSVFLKQGANLIGETTTDSTGYYEFNDLSNGTYELVGICIKGWGGSNSNDANAIMKHFIHLQMLEGLQLQSADVDNNQLVNTLDAFMVSKRFIHLINAFPAGDWVVGDATVTVDGYNVIHNLKATCMGDVNSSFSPPAGFICGDTMADARDGQLYPTVLIGEQCWMAKNLNVGTFIYGVGDQTNNYVIEKFCYHNEIANCNAFGGLYQWWELMDYDTIASSQGICPSGWHVPSNPEWDQIINYLGGYGVAGAALKAGGGSGFEALLAGWVFNCQKFRQMGVQAFFWSSSIYSYSSLYAWSRILSWNGNNVVSMYENQNDGLSVRCLKD